ncbi:MAG: chemotaxis protein CheW [Gammaproteobacteria bacterium]|nr:chemotaxis protein CheW [Gammaproteobacteria bacterium]
MAESNLTEENSSAEAIVSLLASIEERCRKNAVGLPQQEQFTSYWEGVMFYVGEERLITPLSEIKEILNYSASLTKVPGTKPWMLGIANVRGTLLPVVDLQLFLIGRKTVRNRRSRVLVFELGSGASGVLVGEMVGMRHFAKDTAVDKESVSGAFDRYVQYGFDQDGVSWPVFQLSELANDPAFQIAAV